MMRRIARISDNIISPLGNTSAENFEAVLRGRSALALHGAGGFEDEPFAAPEPFVASLFPVRTPIWGYSFFDSLMMRSASAAIKEAGIRASSERVVFIVSSVKGNIEQLPEGDAEAVLLGASARRLAARFGNPNSPVVVSNACISGVTALVEAMRMLQAGRYDYAVVVGCELQSSFIISGFQSLKALSAEPCRPFDAARCGLNAGEAVATMVLAAREKLYEGQWELVSGTTRNDANHISGPSRTGEGSYNCLRYVLDDISPEELAFVNVHGTATLYNDEMESVALERAGLSEVPINALKGVYGHTMGAAGVLETILSMRAVDAGILPGTRGFGELGVTHPVNVSALNRPIYGKAFIKLLSGFGGCNAALLCRKAGPGASREAVQAADAEPRRGFRILREVRLSSEDTDLTETYRTKVGDWPKFYKMDTLSKLGLVATELLLEGTDDRFRPREDRGVVLFMRSGPLCNDRHFQESLDAGFPSPSLFVYTLSNIVTGEICIRNKFLGESTAYVLDSRDEWTMKNIVEDSLSDRGAGSLVTGWIDCRSEKDFEAQLYLVEKK